MYQVKVIQNMKQLADCPVFQINHYQWSGEYRPKAFGQMALLEHAGLAIFTCLNSSKRQLSADL